MIGASLERMGARNVETWRGAGIRVLAAVEPHRGDGGCAMHVSISGESTTPRQKVVEQLYPGRQWEVSGESRFITHFWEIPTRTNG